MSTDRASLSVWMGFGAAIVVAVVSYFAMEAFQADAADAASANTEVVAARAGATVTPTAPPLRIEPK